MIRTAARPREQILDLPLQDIVGREANRVAHPTAFQRLVDFGPEVPVVRRLLLRAVNGALGTVDVEDHSPRARAGRGTLNQVRVDGSQSLVVPLLREDIRLEPMQRGRERDARGSSFAGRQHQNVGSSASRSASLVSS
jgi:hypothetical protein